MLALAAAARAREKRLPERGPLELPPVTGGRGGGVTTGGVVLGGAVTGGVVTGGVVTGGVVTGGVVTGGVVTGGGVVAGKHNCSTAGAPASDKANAGGLFAANGSAKLIWHALHASFGAPN